MRVLKVITLDGRALYVQKITEKTICIILNEDLVAHYSTKTGKFRGPKTLSEEFTSYKEIQVPIAPIKNYFKFNNLEDWDGGWKTRKNSRGEVKYPDMPKFKKFKNHSNPMEDWFAFQGVKVTQINA